MIEVIAKVSESKALSLSKKVLGNKMDNSVTKVIFQEISDVANLNNKYVAFLNPNNEIFLFPLNSEDNSFIVTLSLTQIAGTYAMLYLATTQAIDEDGNIPSDSKMFVSNGTQFTIQDNFLDDSIEQTIVDDNLKLIYDQLEQTIIYLNSDAFQEELINNLHISENDIENIANNIKNDETFKEEIKGEKGEDGRGIYEEWIDQNKYIEGLVDGSNLFYWNKTTLEYILSQSQSFNNEKVLETDATVLIYNHNDKVFNIYNAGDLNNRVGWITLSEEIQKEKESSYFILNTSTKIISILDRLFLKVPFLYVDEYTEEYMKGPEGPQGPAGQDGKSAYQSWLNMQDEKEDFIDIKDQELFNFNFVEFLVQPLKISKISTVEPYGGCIIRFLDVNKNPINSNDLLILYTDGQQPNSIRCKNLCYISDLGTYEVDDTYFDETNYADGKITLQRIFQGIYSQRTSTYQNVRYFMNSLNYLWRYIRVEYVGVGFNGENVSFIDESMASLRTKTEEYFVYSLKGENGKDYTITEADYEEIADVVFSKMINAEEVDY